MTPRALPLASLGFSLSLSISCAAPPRTSASIQTPTPVASSTRYAPSANPPLSAPLPEAQKKAGIPYPRFALPTAKNRPTLGPETAPVTIEIFSDFECPYCAMAQRNLDELDRRFPGKIRRVYRAFPLSGHPNAMLAALMAESAHAQAKFWPFYRALFSQAPLNPEKLWDLAKAQGLDLSLLKRDLDTLAHASRVQRDLDLAKTLGVNATPIFYVNGRRVEGSSSLPLFTHYIDQELRVAQGLSADKGTVYTQLTQHGYTGIALAPEPPSIHLSHEGAPQRGPKDAPVTIVAFTDFECPYCIKGQAELRAALSAYPNQVRLVFRHMPLPFHTQGQKAAKIAVLAQREQKFWSFHDAVFAHQGALDDESLLAMAQKIGINKDTALAAMLDQDGSLGAIIQKDLDLAASLGLRGTPAYVVAGRIKKGVQPELTLRLAIARELSAQGDHR